MMFAARDLRGNAYNVNSRHYSPKCKGRQWLSSLIPAQLSVTCSTVYWLKLDNVCSKAAKQQSISEEKPTTFKQLLFIQATAHQNVR